MGRLETYPTNNSGRQFLQIIMTQGSRKGISHVWRIWQSVQPELTLDGPLNLVLGCAAAAGDGLLDARGVVADHRQIVQRGRQKDHPAGMTHQDRCSRMGVMRIELLD